MRVFLACNIIISPIELYIIYFTEKYTVKSEKAGVNSSAALLCVRGLISFVLLFVQCLV